MCEPAVWPGWATEESVVKIGHAGPRVGRECGQDGPQWPAHHTPGITCHTYHTDPTTAAGPAAPLPRHHTTRESPKTCPEKSEGAQT